MDELMKAEILRQQEIRQNQRIGQYELNNKLYTNRNTQPPVSRPVPPVQYDHGVQSNSGQVKAFPQLPVATPQPSASINDAKTQKSLDYLRAELFKLYKSRNVSYDKVAATQLITKALATTIAQVNNIGAKAGCGDNALNFWLKKPHNR